MATLEDIVAATKILSEDPESIMGSSGSKPQDNLARASDVRKDDSVSAAGSERDVESETIVESTFNEEKEKIGVKSLSSVSYSHSSVRVNGIDSKMDLDGSQDKFFKSSGVNEIAKDSLVENGGKELNGSEREGVYMDVDGEGEERMGEKLNDHENAFHVGDFVWGKIRSHPWWPGQVYDPTDASEFALKRKQQGRLLVAFFGDGSCSWCLPSQLIPFVENFTEMSTDSSSKSFLNAVEMALDEISRVVESEMSCNCISKEKKEGLARLAVENAGLKAGVLMPDVDAKRLSIPEFEPEKVPEKVMQLAKGVSIDSPLDLAIMRGCLSAFYYYKRGHQLPVYHEPLHIDGLEDKNKNVSEVATDFSVPIEVPILRPQDEDWLSSPTVGSANSHGLVENKVSHKRKQKSVAELMGENKNVKPESRKRGSVKEGADFEGSKSSQKRKKSKDGEVSNEGTSSGKKSKKRKVEISESPKITNAKDSNRDSSGLGGSNSVNGRPLLRKPKEIEVASAENASGEAKEEMEKVSSPRERKKSKYLSPPYTNPAWRTGNSSSRTELEGEHDKTPKIGEHKKEAMGDDLASQPTSESVDNASEGKLPNGQLERLNVSDDRSPQTVKADKKLSFSVSVVDAPVDGLLSDIELAAADPLYLSKKASLDEVLAFVSALRSSTNLHGQDYKVYHKGKADGKRKALPSQLGREPTQTKAKSPKASKSERKSGTSSSKKSAETSVATSTMEEGTTLPCLILQFAAGFPLPSKKEIMGLFSKYGSLNKRETKVDTDSHSICIVYIKDSDAEEAFKSSLKESPYGSTEVDYRLQRSPAVSKPRRSHPKVSSPLKQGHEKQEASIPSNDLVSDMNTIRQKLEITTAIVENYHSKFSSQDRSSLKEEIKHLVETVETVSDKVRVMAEKTTS